MGSSYSSNTCLGRFDSTCFWDDVFGTRTVILGSTVRRKHSSKYRRYRRSLRRKRHVRLPAIHLLSVGSSILPKISLRRYVSTCLYVDSNMGKYYGFHLFNRTNRWSIACAQICLALWLCWCAMASFKDVLIRDVRSENACNLQFQHTPLELKRHQDLQFSRVEPSSNEDEIPDIDEVEIPECERKAPT